MSHHPYDCYLTVFRIKDIHLLSKGGVIANELLLLYYSCMRVINHFLIVNSFIFVQWYTHLLSKGGVGS